MMVSFLKSKNQKYAIHPSSPRRAKEVWGRHRTRGPTLTGKMSAASAEKLCLIRGTERGKAGPKMGEGTHSPGARVSPRQKKHLHHSVHTHEGVLWGF